MSKPKKLNMLDLHDFMADKLKKKFSHFKAEEIELENTKGEKIKALRLKKP